MLLQKNLQQKILNEIRNDFLLFARYSFEERTGHPFIVAPHHIELASALERIVLGQISCLIINIPPRSGKTELAVKSFIAWCLGHFPDAEFIHATYSKRLASSNAAEIRAIMLHDSYKTIFGKPEFRDDSNAKDEFKLKAGGVVYATGAEGAITGYGAGKKRDYFGGAIIVDDPQKPIDANSEIMRKNAIDWFKNTLQSRKNDPKTPMIIIMQRLHEDDLCGWLLSGGNGEQWEHLNIPAIKDDGTSFWEEQFTIADLERMQKNSSYEFAAQFMQRPSPLGGGILKTEWWQYYTQAPQFQWRAIYADTAQKTGQENDYSVFQCWGCTATNQAYLVDQVRGKYEAPELLNVARAFWYKHKNSNNGNLRKLAIEDKVSGTGLIQTLKREGIPVLGIKRDKDKTTRALDVAPIIESGNAFLPRDAHFLSEFLAEAEAFPNGKHDDQLDPCFDALSDIQSPKRTPIVGRYGS